MTGDTSDTRSGARLEGRRALVTGGSRGIGAAICRELAARGASGIVIGADDARGLDSISEELRGLGADVTTVIVDLRKADDAKRLVDEAGTVDILVNNAAPGQGSSMFLDTDDAAWDLQLEVILRAAVRLIRLVGPSMVERGRGSIINISSMSVRDAAPYVAPYAAAKAGLEVVTRVAALEMGPSGVRTNAVAPSFVPTQRVAHLVADEVALAAMAARVPLGRLATPEDIARAVGWLASDDASFVNGQVLTVDGGATAGHWRPKQ